MQLAPTRRTRPLAATALLALAASLAAPTPAPAADPPPATRPATAPATRPAKERDADGRLVTRLTLPPAAVPEPHLSVRLLPPATDETPGNGVPHLLMAIESLAARLEYVEPSDHFHVPPADFADALRAAGRAGEFERAGEFDVDWLYPADDYFADLLALAVRRERFEWDWPVREFGRRTLLAPLNDVRAAANWLGGRARLQIAGGDVAGAAGTVQTGFALSRTLGDRPLLVTCFVEIGIAHLFLQRLQEVMAAPGAPNFYWALADLPRPYVDPRDLVRYESEIVYASLPGLAEIERDPGATTPAQVRAALAGIMPQGAEPAGDEEPGWAAQAAYALLRPRAAAFLTEQAGVPADRVRAMPADQVVGLYWLLQFRRAVDVEYQRFLLPYPVVAGAYAADRAEREAREAGAAGAGGVAIDLDNPLGPLMPSLGGARVTQVRLDRDVALLMAVEAVRAHAAGHGGLPPGSLDEVVDTPVLPDPFTGGPFGYAVDPADPRTFTLTSDVPGEPKQSARYVVTLAGGE